MNVTRKHFVNRLYNLFCDVLKVNGGNQQEAFEEVTEGQTRSVKNDLKAELYAAGYTEIK